MNTQPCPLCGAEMGAIAGISRCGNCGYKYECCDQSSTSQKGG